MLVVIKLSANLVYAQEVSPLITRTIGSTHEYWPVQRFKIFPVGRNVFYIVSYRTTMNKIITQKITPFLWFDHDAEDAARFYTSIFKNSRITDIAHYGESAAEAS